jgi:hypothetical protein
MLTTFPPVRMSRRSGHLPDSNVKLQIRWQKGDGAVKCYARLEQMRRMDPYRQAAEIYRLSVAYEFPWDLTRALVTWS